LALTVPSPAFAQTVVTTTTDLNMRTGPSTGHSIIAEIPAGASLEVTGYSSNGYFPVNYNGRSGFAHGAYLMAGGGSAVSGGGATGAARVIDGALNLRSGPGTSYPVIAVMPGGSPVELTGESGNGFLGVVYNGTRGFAFADYLSASGASGEDSGSAGSVPVGDTTVGSATVTSALNLRSGPGTAYPVLIVMQRGAGVELRGDPQGGFHPVAVAGMRGWASGDWLSIGGNTPAPSGNNDIISIIYAAADAYGQPREDMLRVARCESVLDPGAVNASSGASGLFQFMPGTWATTPYADQDIFDATANANAAAWMWAVGRRNEWTCQ
jgi:uncharacterized protein YraI